MTNANPQLKTTRNRIAIFFVAGAFLVAVAFALRYSVDPRMYFSYDPKEEGLREYPWSHVLVTLGFMLTYSALLFAAVIRSHVAATWIRSGVAFFLLLGWSLYISRFFLHMPGYWLIHLAYLWAVLIVTGAAFVIAIGHKLWSILPMRKGGHA